MKKFIATATIASVIAAGALFAGDLAEPVITEVEDPGSAASSSAPWLIWALLLGAVVVIASQDDNSSSQENGIMMNAPNGNAMQGSQGSQGAVGIR